LLPGGLPETRGQGDSFTKNFKKFANLAPGIDVFARSREDAAPFEKPIGDSQQRLATFLAGELARGALVICSTLEQKDSVNEPRVLKMGYKWVLIQLTPQASTEQMLAQMKSRMGGQLPPGALDRMKNQSPEMKKMMERGLVGSTVQRVGYAILVTTLNPGAPFRSSRLDDMGRSPLADWLDIGLASYAAGTSVASLGFLRDRLEEGFPLEDVLSMSRPFVAPSAGGTGPGMVIRMGPEGGPVPGPGVTVGPAPSGPPAPQAGPIMDRPARMGMPKDVQDRMTFDAQAALFFSYLSQKVGLEKTKELVQWNREGKPSREFLTRADVLGPDLEKIEEDWQEWVKQQKVEGPNMRFMTSPARPPTP
jgi:hypothetical protein